MYQPAGHIVTGSLSITLYDGSTCMYQPAGHIVTGSLSITLYDGSTCMYQPAGHIVTGSLSIVCNNVLEDLLTKGRKFREPRSISWNRNFNSIVNDAEDYSSKCAKKKGVDDHALCEWVKAIKHFILFLTKFYDCIVISNLMLQSQYKYSFYIVATLWKCYRE